MGLRWAVGILLVVEAIAAVGVAPAWSGGLPFGPGSPPVPPGNRITPARVELGRRLFYDADLSLDGTMACASCHEQHHAFADGNATHPGVTGERGRRNVPGLANVAWLSPLTYADKRQTTLERQLEVPLFGGHPVEMGMAGHEGEIAARLGRDPCYRAMFRRAFPETGGRIDVGNVARAIAGFERTLVSFDSAWDNKVLAGAAVRGGSLFARDCAACHKPPLFTDMTFHRLEPVAPTASDQGLAENTGKQADRGRFRTPSLRNVTLTGPWWHDGSAGTLAGAIARHGIRYENDDEVAVEAFLGALSDTRFTQAKALSLPAQACGRRL